MGVDVRGSGGVGVALLSEERSGELGRRDGGRMLRIVERRGKSVRMVLHGLTTEEVRMTWVGSRKAGAVVGRRAVGRLLGRPARGRRLSVGLVMGGVGRRRRRG